MLEDDRRSAAVPARPIDVPGYQRLAGMLPAPTEAQTTAFVDFVCHAHSWYKHMHLWRARSPLHFFLDPAAGMQRVVRADGTVDVEHRVTQGLHHAWIPTDRYRERFGHLAFSRSSGTSVSMRTTDGGWVIPSDDGPLVFDPGSGSLAMLPAEIASAGCAFVSGLIHTLGADHARWRHILLADDDSIEWPAESGGTATLATMRERCRLLAEHRELQERLDTSRRDDEARLPEERMHLGLIDLPFYRLVEPERRRQVGLMIDAIHRMLAMARPPAPSR